MKVLVTGGCGFIGSNIVNDFAKEGNEVVAYDNLSRKGVDWNKKWLEQQHGSKVKFINTNITDSKSLVEAAKDTDIIFHTAAQVTVTDSVKDPRKDFDINALGTLNVMEAARLSNTNPVVIYTSTNKVYGHGINYIPLKQGKMRWEFDDPRFKNGIPETFTTDDDDHSPYGVSKYVGDLYTRDYAHTFGIPTIVFRQSCIYGTRQFGYEDQGWVVHFVISSVLGRPLNIFGDGKQVRDALFIDDLMSAFKMAIEKISKTKGKAYNMGGGPENTTSLLELISLLERLNGKKIETKYFDWRPADQKVYISNISRAKEDFGWEPKVSVEQGITRVNEWVKANTNLFAK